MKKLRKRRRKCLWFFTASSEKC